MTNDLVIPLETLTPPKAAWPVTSPQSYIAKNYEDVYSTSIDKDIVDYKHHPVLKGFIDAFKQHRPVTISPDIIWLLIVQGFTHHVLFNAEKLRKKFVNFTGKQELTVRREGMLPQTATNDDWQGIFGEFVQQMESYTGKKVTETLKPCFSTTTPVSLAVGQLSIMCGMKKYFGYRVEMCECGIPTVTIEGTVKDWEKILLKLKELENYDLKWWINVIKPHIQEIVNTKKGKINKDFWLRMIRYRDNKGRYVPSYVDGWLISFFPYDVCGGRNGLEQIYSVNNIPSEMLKIPFDLVVFHRGQNPRDVPPIKCEFVAGFVGLTQNTTTFNIKPEIGWIIKKKQNISDEIREEEEEEFSMSDNE